MGFFSNRGETLLKSGNQLFTPDGVMINSGNMSFRSDGSTIHKSGNILFGPKGNMCKSGNMWFGNKNYTRSGSMLFCSDERSWTGVNSDADAELIIKLDM